MRANSGFLYNILTVTILLLLIRQPALLNAKRVLCEEGSDAACAELGDDYCCARIK